jgi:membrane-associated protease RseP (regulator of RpoE activity)
MAYRGEGFPDELELIDSRSLARSQAASHATWIPREEPVARRVPTINIVLFLTTLATTTLAGANNVLGRAINPFAEPGALIAGLPFAVTLMSILLVHELGHYIMSRVHGVQATLPYFLPGPPFLVGTFGAFIRMKSPPADRRALFDVGAAGPWAGVLVAIPAVLIGLSLSEVRPMDGPQYGLFFGDSILFSVLTRIALDVSPDEMTIILHPVALAGWIGLFVTFLNLIPVGQLDGGHVSYSLFGPSHRWPARVFLLVIFVLGFQGWRGWFLWTILLLMLGIDHPPTRDRSTPLDPVRRVAAWATLVLFVVTFIPVPFAIELPTELPPVPAVPAVPMFDGPVTPAGLFIPAPWVPAGPTIGC